METGLFLLAGDSEPRGSRRRLISIRGEMECLFARPCTGGVVWWVLMHAQSQSQSRVEVC